MRFTANRFLLLLGVWLVITAGELAAVPVGVLAAAAAAVVSVRLLPPGPGRVRLRVVAALLPIFLLDSWRGGVDVARRALHPRLPIRPGWLSYPLRLPPGTARVSLGNFLSLMPGTLAAGERHDALYVHALDATPALELQIARDESRVGRMLDIGMAAPDG